MPSILKLSLLLSAVALVLWVTPLSGKALVAFVSGGALFVLNLVALMVASRRLLAAEGPKMGSGGFLLFGGKFVLLGLGAYVALVTYGLRVDFFVGGLCAGLGLFSALLYADEAKRATATP